MEILILVGAFLIEIVMYLYIKYKIYDKVVLTATYHRKAHTKEYVSNYRFIQANVLENELLPEEDDIFKPIINLDNNKIKNIAFMNNVNFVFMNNEGRLSFSLYNPEVSLDRLSFETRDYNTNINLTKSNLSNVLVSSTFPKKYNNSLNRYNLVNLKDIGYDVDFYIKEQNIIAMHFDNNKKKMFIFFRNHLVRSIEIEFRTKTEMLKKLKESKLNNYINQWGIPGYTDSVIEFIKYYEVGEDNARIDK